MTDISRILRVQAKEKSIPLWVIEKDYAMSYVLAGIANTPGLGDRIVLKGGTALKKAYFLDYRFSEDLDYSTTIVEPLLGVDQLMGSAAQRTENNLKERGLFRVQMERLVLREPHPGGQAAFTIRVQFPYHRQPMCRVKVEISVDEPVLLVPENCAILHEYPEPSRKRLECTRWLKFWLKNFVLCSRVMHVYKPAGRAPAASAGITTIFGNCSIGQTSQMQLYLN